MTSHALLVSARLLERTNRFVVRAALDTGSIVEAHLADPGRLTELMRPGARLRLRPSARDARRRTAYTVALVRAGRPGPWVGVETPRANRLAARLLEQRALRGVARYTSVRREVRCGGNRFDFLLRGGAGPSLWVEVKSVTLVEDGVGRFPDAPTERGRRHVAELAELVRAGERALVLFVVQRDDARAVVPHATIDAAFADTLREARRAGVALRAVRFRMLADDSARYLGALPVRTATRRPPASDDRGPA